MAWVVACPSTDVKRGVVKRQRLENGEPVGLTRLKNNSVVVFHNNCPHFKGPLGLGKLHEDSIVCPWHFFRFDLATGKAEGTDASIMHLKLYQVEEKNGEIFIEL